MRRQFDELRRFRNKPEGRCKCSIAFKLHRDAVDVKVERTIEGGCSEDGREVALHWRPAASMVNLQAGGTVDWVEPSTSCCSEPMRPADHGGAKDI